MSEPRVQAGTPSSRVEPIPHPSHGRHAVLAVPDTSSCRGEPEVPLWCLPPHTSCRASRAGVPADSPANILPAQCTRTFPSPALCLDSSGPPTGNRLSKMSLLAPPLENKVWQDSYNSKISASGLQDDFSAPTLWLCGFSRLPCGKVVCLLLCVFKAVARVFH